MDKRGYPGRRSAQDVDADSNYERVTELDGKTWPSSVQHIVRHKPTGTLWSGEYLIRDDDSDYDLPIGWVEVVAREKTVVVYEPKKE
jgi:hypothetical protein